MTDSKRSRGINCRLDCPGRAVSGKLNKSYKIESKDPRRRQRYKRKRQNLVYNPEEEVWHEPYMQPLRKELSRVSILCDSKIELPWKDIAVTSTGEKIRPKVVVAERMSDEKFLKISNEESSDLMKLPWSDLVIDDIAMNVKTKKNETRSCDSSLEIPWNDLLIKDNINIVPPPIEQKCPREDIEIPWNAILVPRNIIIEPKTVKHPSSKVPTRKNDKRSYETCCTLACCARNK